MLGVGLVLVVGVSADLVQVGASGVLLSCVSRLNGWWARQDAE